MTNLLKGLLFLALIVLSSLTEMGREPISLFDGKTFAGWEGDTTTTWRIEDGAIVGGSFIETVPHNNFLTTKESYDDFVLRLKFKLQSKEGFKNAGIQFRSQRLADPAHEMIGYQADLGPGYYGALYDESRRKEVLMGPDSLAVSRLVKADQWNDYEIRAEGRHIQLFLNGQKTVDYTEPDTSIPQEGLIGLQIHGGGKTVVAYKDLVLEEL